MNGVNGVPGLFGEGFTADPYPAYGWLREHAPVHKAVLPSGVSAWLVTRYADARQALADPRLSKDPGRTGRRSTRRGGWGSRGSAARM